jgi:hypothetical protein
LVPMSMTAMGTHGWYPKDRRKNLCDRTRDGPLHQRACTDRVARVKLARVTWAVVVAPALAFAQVAPVDPFAPPPAPEPAPAEPAPAEPAPVEPAPDEPAPEAEPVDPDTIAPESLPDAPAEVIEIDPPRWPLSLPARPLLYPDGTFAVGLGGSMYIHDRPMVSAKAGRVSLAVARVFGTTQVGVSGTFVAFTTQQAADEDKLAFPTVASLVASVRHLVGDELALDGYFAARGVGSEYQGWSPGASLVKKVHFSDRAALHVDLGLEYERGVIIDRDAPTLPVALQDFDRFALSATLAVEANIRPRASLFASTTITQNVFLDDPGIGGNTIRSYTSRLALVLTQNDSVDLWINLNLISGLGVSAKSISVFLDIRRFP